MENKNFFNNLEYLCNLDGVSGQEDIVIDAIIEQIKPLKDCTYSMDSQKNIIVFKKGKKVPAKKIMLAAHTDEVGLMITGVTSDGMLNITTVGGINPKVIIGRAVRVGEKGLVGVIGTKAMHMQSDDEKNSVIPVDKLYIDIGATSRENALEFVSLGDGVAFYSEYKELGDGFIKAKAIDDRAGCAIMIEILKEELEFDTHFLFCSQEEVGLRGSRVGAYTINPDVAIVIESTASADVAGVSGEMRVSVLGEGPVVSYRDLSTMYDRELYARTFEIAKERGIKCQTKTMISGGNDAGAIHVSRGGVKTIAVSIPSRYIHSPSSVVKKSDVQDSLSLVKAMLCDFAQNL